MKPWNEYRGVSGLRPWPFGPPLRGRATPGHPPVLAAPRHPANVPGENRAALRPPQASATFGGLACDATTRFV